MHPELWVELHHIGVESSGSDFKLNTNTQRTATVSALVLESLITICSAHDFRNAHDNTQTELEPQLSCKSYGPGEQMKHDLSSGIFLTGDIQSQENPTSEKLVGRLKPELMLTDRVDSGAYRFYFLEKGLFSCSELIKNGSRSN